MTAEDNKDSLLGAFLRERRARLDPADFGLSRERRRTPGLRREEVAQRAHISPTWYTWLEQGRGGAPSGEVLERIAQALGLTDIEREHLFLLGLGRQPEVRFRKQETIAPRLQRVLDALEPCPAMIRTAAWDVLAWNRAVAVTLTDYAALPPERRNILRAIFLDPRVRQAQHDWDSVARFVVGAFRLDAARAGAGSAIEPLVAELCDASPAFAAMWRDNEVRSHGEGMKRLRHPRLGSITMEYSSFAVDGRPDLTMVIYGLVTADDARRIATLIAEREHLGA